MTWHSFTGRDANVYMQVEVEVQRNAFVSEQPAMTSTFRGQADMVQRTMRHHLDKLHDHAQQAVGGSHASGSAPPRPKSGPPTPEENGEDEGWQSDRSASEPSTSKLVSAPDGASPERAGGKHKKKHGLPVHVRSRRRSARRPPSHVSPLPSIVTTPVGSPPETPPETPGGERGRRTGVVTSPGAGSVARRGPQHAHIDRLRNLESRSRGVSPARSIRWADDEARETLSPLASPRDSIASPSSPPEEGESARHVVFELPSLRPKSSSQT